MPIEVFYILGLLAVICVAFLLFKRPIYECMFYGYVLMIICTGEWANFFTYIGKTSTDTLFYAIVAFLVLAKMGRLALPVIGPVLTRFAPDYRTLMKGVA